MRAALNMCRYILGDAAMIGCIYTLSQINYCYSKTVVNPSSCDSPRISLNDIKIQIVMDSYLISYPIGP